MSLLTFVFEPLLFLLQASTVIGHMCRAPMTWLYCSEIQPLETRAAGQSISSFVFLLFGFVIGQTYLTMLCAFRWGLYIFFAGICLLGTVVMFFFFPGNDA